MVLAAMISSYTSYSQQGIPVQKIAEMQQITVVAGTSVTAQISFNIAPEYHLQSNRPQNDALIPTVLEIEAVRGIETGKISYRLANNSLNKVPDYYSGELKVSFPVRVSENLKRGNYILHGNLSYQAGTERSCLFPKNCEFDIRLHVL